MLVKESGRCQCTLFNYFRKLPVAIRKKNLWCDNLGAIFKTYPADMPDGRAFFKGLRQTHRPDRSMLFFFSAVPKNGAAMCVGWSN
jgi:hypothetical protein